MPKYKGQDDEFIMASHAQRLQLSKCFIESNKQINKGNKAFETLNLTCITCHNPHVSVKKTGTQIFNNACAKCHSGNDQMSCSENKNQLTLKQNDCVSCHMPRSGTIDIPHVTVHDHWIKKPRKVNNVNQIKQFVDLYCINNQSVNDFSKAKALINQVEKFDGNQNLLENAIELLKKESDQPKVLEAEIHRLYLQNNFDEIIKKASFVKINEQKNAWFCYRIGQAFFSKNDFVRAELCFQKAVSISPKSIDFVDKLAQSKIVLNKLNEAIELLTDNLKSNPKQVNSFINLGFAYAKQNKLNLAKENYQKALALDPDSEQALINLAAIYGLTNDKEKAKMLLNRVLEVNKNNETAKKLLKEISS
jgi:tetratricopeptide (TPR) repeat protein